MIIKWGGRLHYLFEKAPPPQEHWEAGVWSKKIAAGVTEKEYRRQVQLENDAKLAVARTRIKLIDDLARKEAEIVAMNKLTPCEVADRLEKIVARAPTSGVGFSPRTLQDWVGGDVCHVPSPCTTMSYTKQLVNSLACGSAGVTGCGVCEVCTSGYDYTAVRRAQEDSAANALVHAAIIGGFL